MLFNFRKKIADISRSRCGKYLIEFSDKGGQVTTVDIRYIGLEGYHIRTKLTGLPRVECKGYI